MAEIYPSNYPCPTWEYSEEITTYPERKPMECGWTRQRKRWPSTGTGVTLAFTMDTATFETWATWIQTYGYEWFTIDLDRFNGTKKATDLRFIAPYTYQYTEFNVISVRAAAEFYDGDA